MGDPKTARPAATASGTLARTPFLHLLVYSLDKKLTGSIELLSPDKRSVVVVFDAGQPAKVRTSEPIAYLGRVLRDLGHLTEDQLTRSLTELAKSKALRPTMHGELLVGQGVIDEAKLQEGLREQLARKLRHAGALVADTVYAYYPDFDALRGWGGDGVGIDPIPLLWSMLVEHPPWDHVTSALDRVATCPLRLKPNADLTRLHLGPEELQAATTLRARAAPVPEFAGLAGLNDHAARLLAYLLLVTKQVDALAPAPAASVAPAPRDPSRPPPTQRSITPAAPTATPSGRPSAPFRLSAPPPSLHQELAERWREITERAKTIDRTDYFMMLDVARDATSDEVEAAFFALVKRWHPDRLPPELAPVRDVCSRVFARMSEAHATLTDSQRRANYMRLLADGSGSPEMQATVAKVIEAATAFQKADVCFRRNDFVQAETFCRKAVDDDPTQPDYLAMLAWLISLKPENQAPAKAVESIKMLERAISMSDRCERAYYWRGMLFKKLGKNEAAYKDFRHAAELNPRNIDAAREVRLYTMRGGRRSSKPPPARRSSPSPAKADDVQKPGILGRLFKKP
jgi:DnaJ-like protein/tetratricopeptide repeat protein